MSNNKLLRFLRQKISHRYLNLNALVWTLYFRIWLSRRITGQILKEQRKIELQKEHIQSLWIISSVIEPVEKKLSYSHHRSTFTNQERLEQTKSSVLSINSVEKKPLILIVDGSKSNFADSFPETNVHYHQITEKALLRVINSPFKGLGEAIMLLISEHLLENSDEVMKLSGRYSVTKFHSFNIGFHGISEAKAISIYYGMKKDIFKRWSQLLWSEMNKLAAGVSMEELLTEFSNAQNMEIVDTLGAQGQNGITGGLASH